MTVKIFGSKYEKKNLQELRRIEVTFKIINSCVDLDVQIIYLRLRKKKPPPFCSFQ